MYTVLLLYVKRLNL